MDAADDLVMRSSDAIAAMFFRAILPLMICVAW